MADQLSLVLASAPPALDIGSLCDAEERAVAQALRWGRAHARRVAEIAADAGVPERRAQEFMQHLLHEHHWPIGTAMAAPFGNYLIDSPAELEETVALLRTRGISSLSRAAALRRMSLKRYLAEVQTALELEARQ